MDFDLNLPWEGDIQDILDNEVDLDNIVLDDIDNNRADDENNREDDVGNNVEEEAISFNEFSLDDYLNDETSAEDVVGNGGFGEGLGEDGVVQNENVDNEIHAPPVIEGGFVQKVANMINSGNTDIEKVDPPTKGMTFPNGDELGAYCYLYAYQTGFQWFIRSNKIYDCYKSKGVKRHGSGNNEPRFYMMNRIRLCCTRGAEPTKKNGYINDPSYKKCNCVVEATVKDDFIVIKQARLEHNHDDVNPANARHMVGYRLWDDYFKRRALINDEAGISIAKNFHTLVREVGGHSNLPILERDLRNMLNQERRRSRINGDANALEERFIKLKEIDPDFYYSIQTDAEGKLLNVFWADGRCRAMAKVFGDAVSYDATFLCNRYKMPFTPFVGVNHHHRTVVLASALISHEDAVSFTWVFRKWMDCMGTAPSVIITDQCRGIGRAVKNVFPNTPHRLCLWHMMRNGAKNLGSNARYEEIRVDLNNVVYESKDIADFESSWQHLLNKYSLRTHSWMTEVYAKRELWVPLYWRKLFCAGMSSTQRSEQTNRFFKIYVNPQTTLFTFLGQYENALRVKAEDEEKLNFVCSNRPCRYDKNVIVEEVFHRAYTNTMFAKVKKEVYNLIHINAVVTLDIGNFSVYEVTEELKNPFWRPRDKTYTVSINTGNGEFTCTCQHFEFKGILCRHIIRGLMLKKVQLIPEKYILSRFRKDLVRGYEHLHVGYRTPAESDRLKRSLAVTLRNNYIYRLALQSDEAFAIYDEETKKLVKEMEGVVGIQTLNAMGAGSNALLQWGRRRLQSHENNQRYMVRNATPRREGGLQDPPDRRGTGRAPRPRQTTVRRAVNMDEAGPSQPAAQRRRTTRNTARNTQ